VCVSVCVLCICLYVRKGTHVFLHGLDTPPPPTHTPHLTTNKVRRRFEERLKKTNGGFAVPKPLVPALLFHQRKGHYHDNHSVSFRVGQTASQVAHICDVGVKIIWGCIFYSKKTSSDVIECFPLAMKLNHSCVITGAQKLFGTYQYLQKRI